MTSLYTIRDLVRAIDTLLWSATIKTPTRRSYQYHGLREGCL